METTANTPAAENAVTAIKELLGTVEHDTVLKQKLAETLAALTGKTAGTPATETALEDSEMPPDAEADFEAEEKTPDNEEESSGGFFNDDLVTGMAIGAAVVGGGVLLYHLLKD